MIHKIHLLSLGINIYKERCLHVSLTPQGVGFLRRCGLPLNSHTQGWSLKETWFT